VSTPASTDTAADDQPRGQVALDGLVELLDLEQLELNLFRGVSPPHSPTRVFGGQVAGQALVAAGRTVPDDREVHSLHAYFIRPGDPDVPILYDVDRLRDGRSFTTRRVVAIQHGKAIFNLSASFHVPEQGLEHQLPFPDNVPDPESMPTFKERMAPYADKMGDWYQRPRPIDQRYVADPPRVRKERRPPNQQVWMRADGDLPDDPLLHACIVAYASDMSLLDSIYLPHAMSWDSPGVQGASLDHAMWFHRPFRADEWVLYDQSSPSASDARGLAEGKIFQRDGRLVVSVVQEGLIRIRPVP